MSRPKILLALAQAAFPALERALSLHADLLFADVLARATELLQARAGIAMVICGVDFDESRMFELLDYVRVRCPGVRFVGVRVRAGDVPPRVSVNAVGLALKALGAVDYIDFAKLAAELGDERAEEQVCRSLVGILEAGIGRA